MAALGTFTCRAKRGMLLARSKAGRRLATIGRPVARN
jgi:hypothetical protein